MIFFINNIYFQTFYTMKLIMLISSARVRLWLKEPFRIELPVVDKKYIIHFTGEKGGGYSVLHLSNNGIIPKYLIF